MHRIQAARTSTLQVGRHGGRGAGCSGACLLCLQRGKSAHPQHESVPALHLACGCQGTDAGKVGINAAAALRALSLQHLAGRCQQLAKALNIFFPRRVSLRVSATSSSCGYDKAAVSHLCLQRNHNGPNQLNRHTTSCASVRAHAVTLY